MKRERERKRAEEEGRKREMLKEGEIGRMERERER
jgi:hypothetical protein